MTEMQKRAAVAIKNEWHGLKDCPGDMYDTEATALAGAALLAALDPEDEKLVEAIARSISLCGRDWDTPFDFDAAPDYAKDMQRDIARTAILTLKQMAHGETDHG